MIWKKYKQMQIRYERIIRENSALKLELKEQVDFNKNLIQILKKNPAKLKIDEEDVFATGFEYYSCECGRFLGHYNEIPHGTLCENCGRYIS